MRRLRIGAVLLLGLLVVLSLAAPGAAQQRDKVVLLLNWYNYGEHGPFYLGLARGYYREEGIDLDIQEGRGSGPTIQAVGAGSAQFGYADLGTTIRAITRGAPVHAVGVLVQTSPMALVGFAEKNIRTPKDLVGKTVAMTPGGAVDTIFLAFAKATGLKEGDYKVVSGDATTKRNAVIHGQADVCTGHINDQSIFIADATGKKVQNIMYADYGVNPVNNGIIVTRDALSKQADLIRRFMRASTKAVEAAVKSPEEATDALLKVNPKAGKREILLAGLQATLPLYHTRHTQGQRPFRVAPADMRATLEIMVEYGGVEAAKKGKAEDYYTNELLP
ncbi:MAG: ABC transporter substrate-binding protein [Candidatus Methylomirabilales bacterium]